MTHSRPFRTLVTVLALAAPLIVLLVGGPIPRAVLGHAPPNPTVLTLELIGSAGLVHRIDVEPDQAITSFPAVVSDYADGSISIHALDTQVDHADWCFVRWEWADPTEPEGLAFEYDPEITLNNMGSLTRTAVYMNTDIRIFNGQGGATMVSEAEEESLGAFSVANLNDTDSDGIIDGARDEEDGTPLDLNVPGEVDLIKVVLQMPQPALKALAMAAEVYSPCAKRVRVVVSGLSDVHLWKSSDKSDGEFTGQDILLSKLPATLWLEGERASGALRDVTVTCEYNTVWHHVQDAVKDTAKATFVGVSKIQYENTSSVFVDTPSILYVLKDTTVTFRAVKTPAGADWPSGKPVWGGNSGASGTNETTYVTFSTLSSTSTDFKTVTAECGNTVTSNVVVYELEGILTPDDWFTDRSTTHYGVEETVSLSHVTDPSGISVDTEWTVLTGVGEVISPTHDTVYDARAIAGNVQLVIEIASGINEGEGPGPYSRTVVAPTSRFIHAASPWDGIWHEEDTYTCGFMGNFYLDPKNVSFTNIQFREGTSPPATLTYHCTDWTVLSSRLMTWPVTPFWFRPT